MAKSKPARGPRWWLAAGVVAVLGLVAAIAYGLLQDQAAAGPRNLAGVRCDTMEGNVSHIHVHLDLFANNKSLGVPGGVGFSTTGNGKPCLFWLHTHDATGVVHIEAPVNETFTLGQFFAVWREPLSETQLGPSTAAKGQTVKAWVNGKPWTGRVTDIPLTPHAEIVIALGPPWPPSPPDQYTFPPGE